MIFHVDDFLSRDDADRKNLENCADCMLQTRFCTRDFVEMQLLYLLNVQNFKKRKVDNSVVQYYLHLYANIVQIRKGIEELNYIRKKSGLEPITDFTSLPLL